MTNKADTYCGKCIKADVCGMENVYDPATTYCAYRVTDNRPHGEWIEKDYSGQTAWATCSICRKKEEQIYNESPDATEETMVICKPFCPNCGVDMREGDET